MKKSLKIILIVLAALILICAAAIGIFYIRINNPANVFDHLNGTCLLYTSDAADD